MKLLKASLEIWWNWWTLNRHRKCLYLWCDDVVTHRVSIMHHCSHKIGSTIGLKLAQTTTTSRPYIALAAGCNPFVGRLVRASAILVRRTWSDSMVHVMFLKYLEYVSDIFQVIDLGQLWTWKGKQTELGRNTKKNQNSQPEWSLYSSISINEQNIESVDRLVYLRKIFSVNGCTELNFKALDPSSLSRIWKCSMGRQLSLSSLSVLLGKLQGCIAHGSTLAWDNYIFK